MSEEKIEAKFAEIHKEGEIAGDELDNVAGGCGERPTLGVGLSLPKNLTFP